MLRFDVVEADTQSYDLSNVSFSIKLFMRVILSILKHRFKVNLILLGNLFLDKPSKYSHHLVCLCSDEGSVSGRIDVYHLGIRIFYLDLNLLTSKGSAKTREEGRIAPATHLGARFILAAACAGHNGGHGSPLELFSTLPYKLFNQLLLGLFLCGVDGC